MADKSDTDKTRPPPRSRRAVVATAARVALTAPAVTLLLQAASKRAFAQTPPYLTPQNPIEDDVTFGNEPQDVDTAAFYLGAKKGIGNQDDRL